VSTEDESLYLLEWQCWVVVQFDGEASQTRDYCVAKNPSARFRLLRAGCDTSRGSPRFLAAQRTLARNDNQTAPLARQDGGRRVEGFRASDGREQNWWHVGGAPQD
jgi:hypothetical protein